MSNRRLITFVVRFSLIAGTAAARADDGPLSFGRDVQPILSQRCFACHGPNGEEGLVRFDRREAMVDGGILLPGRPEASELLRRVTSTDPLERMPPKGEPLTASQVETLRRWIAAGAEFERHWAFEPPKAVEPPPVRNVAWPRNPIDRFVLAKLEQAGLTPAPEADPAVLIRRLSFDLTGLPPTPEEVEAFVSEFSKSPRLQVSASPAKDLETRRLGDEEKAYEALVDKLLASPHYGERAAQHWLDVVRYAETEGFEYDRLLGGAWRYRDYVIDAFNADVPYDRFVTEQLAGDELDADDHRLRTAVGLHRLGPVRRNAGNTAVALSRNEVLTTRTDVVGSAFLGLTFGCARCHDHKFDPIAQRDYYRLQAYLSATDEHDVYLVPEQERAAWEKRNEVYNRELKRLTDLLKEADGDRARELQLQIDAYNAEQPSPLPSITSIRNRDEPSPTHVLFRGEENRRGELVTAGVPEALATTASAAPPVDTGPRTQLAAWIADPGHPLTARVLVNRIWQQHFGVGLVATSNDFGLHGEPPSHPELLDWLAWHFVQGSGVRGQGRANSSVLTPDPWPQTPWSLKSLHRLIVTSASYRQAAGFAPDVDPDNRLLSCRTPQRLDAEALRDAMLAVSGRLNPKRGGPSVVVPVDEELTALLYKPSQWSVTPDVAEHDRRSIYLLAKRNLRLPFMEAFDQPSTQASCARRESSTHAPQALELLNGRWSNDLAAAFAERLTKEASGEAAEQVELAFRLVAGRRPTTTERRLSLEFLQQHTLREFALAVFNLNAFLYVD